MADTVYGTDFDDTIVQDGDFVAADVYGYDGDDDIFLNRTDSLGGDNFVDAGNDNDTVTNYFEGGNDIELGNGNDVYIADIRATDVNDFDVVHGGNGNDRFEVDSEASNYYGDSGNDTFLSVGFNNYFNGGTGNDTISYALQDDYDSSAGLGVTIDLTAGTAKIESGRTEDLRSIENATGTDSNDDIAGSSVRNVLKGLFGADVIEGLGGADDLYGGAGNDDLYGGSGNDDLYGGTGADYLKGGSGEDFFIFDSIKEMGVNAKRDIIADFHRSEGDQIDLATIDANTTRSGNQKFDFIGKAGFSGDGGELRFVNGVVYGDVNGDKVSDFHIKMTGVTKMYADDFIL